MYFALSVFESIKKYQKIATLHFYNHYFTKNNLVKYTCPPWETIDSFVQRIKTHLSGSKKWILITPVPSIAGKYLRTQASHIDVNLEAKTVDQCAKLEKQATNHFLCTLYKNQFILIHPHKKVLQVYAIRIRNLCTCVKEKEQEYLSTNLIYFCEKHCGGSQIHTHVYASTEPKIALTFTGARKHLKQKEYYFSHSLQESKVDTRILKKNVCSRLIFLSLNSDILYNWVDRSYTSTWKKLFVCSSYSFHKQIVYYKSKGSSTEKRRRKRFHSYLFLTFYKSISSKFNFSEQKRRSGNKSTDSDYRVRTTCTIKDCTKGFHFRGFWIIQVRKSLTRSLPLQLLRESQPNINTNTNTNTNTNINTNTNTNIKMFLRKSLYRVKMCTQKLHTRSAVHTFMALVTPSCESKKYLCTQIKSRLQQNRSTSIVQTVSNLNPIVKQWINYFKKSAFKDSLKLVRWKEKQRIGIWLSRHFVHYKAVQKIV